MLVQYDVGAPPPVGPALWHACFITAADTARPGFYAVLTPDGDHYVEELSFACADVADLKYLERSGATPQASTPPTSIASGPLRMPPSGASSSEMVR